MKKMGQKELPKYIQSNFVKSLAYEQQKKLPFKVVVVDEVLPNDAINEVAKKVVAGISPKETPGSKAKDVSSRVACKLADQKKRRKCAKR